MSTRSEIMMVLSNRRKQLVQHMMWVAQDRPKKLQVYPHANVIKRRVDRVVSTLAWWP